ncbi:MAG: ACP S-malonyltransferase [Treponema sp.]|jgi:[acyl-carrier-protein] S-malonyltransferase|nr:ACP S-malonyltransferase [Treponema sp.]
MVKAELQKAAFLFPGQGAQYPQMALDFLEEGSGGAAELFDLASEITGRDMRAFLKNADRETLKRTDVSQPAITLANLAAAAFLAERGIKPAVCAGFSLGEYAALAAAGVITAGDSFRLVKARGEAMQKAADRLASQGAPGMAAVLGLDPETAESLIAEWKIPGLYAANINSPRQIVVSGTAGALEEGGRRFKEAGARRYVRLEVAGPFHSPLVAEASEEFRPVLEAVPFGDPAVPLYSNVTGKRVRSGAEAKILALRQITGPVRWTEEEDAVAKEGIDAALETGPGKVLAGLWKEVQANIPCRPAGTAADIRTLTEYEPEEKACVCKTKRRL